MSTTIDRQPAGEQPRGILARLAGILGVMRDIDQNTEARQAAAQAAAALAESQRRAAEARAGIAADRDLLLDQIIALTFQFGRMQGRAEAAQDRIAEMTAQARTDTP